MRASGVRRAEAYSKLTAKSMLAAGSPAGRGRRPSTAIASVRKESCDGCNPGASLLMISSVVGTRESCAAAGATGPARDASASRSGNPGPPAVRFDFSMMAPPSRPVAMINAAAVS